MENKTKMLLHSAMLYGITQELFDELYNCDENENLKLVNISNSKVAPREYIDGGLWKIIGRLDNAEDYYLFKNKLLEFMDELAIDFELINGE